MTLAEIAQKMDAHLKRIAEDPALNPTGTGKLRPYFHPFAAVAGRYVKVSYVSYQSTWSMPKSVAAAYLAWLEAGNVGKFDNKGRSFGPVVLAGK